MSFDTGRFFIVAPILACCGLFQLHVQFWPLDPIGNCLCLVSNCDESSRLSCEVSELEFHKMRVFEEVEANVLFFFLNDHIDLTQLGC